ncbi:DNA cytosine methyltransferase [Microbacterium betulae]|uniref:DNA (cytosine-5-)-methyltransferase n=1 Tax=Microbacterium betulae TaxID=2981139 RepID=A0AA97FJE1_9MICO|nr:DNA cytosine methyltransferase [Microbacterium sp. AB]WOF23809.1 DNA cytosine methyltransferase [Microbacterium sp. AB]
MSATAAVDAFAGVGWGVACEWLGVREYGIERAKEAIRSRTANGMRTIVRDVWSGLFFPWLIPAHRLYIASPPCQTFSMAGNGEGRDALADVLAAIDDESWKKPEQLHGLADRLDPRTALVLTPLAHIWAHRPELVALEQVPEVLPVWHAIAAVLRTLGYSVWTGILRAEMFGVPQTRKRAILMARLDGKVQPPAPTHSRYYSTDPSRLDAGVEKWVSMAEALGWDSDDPREAHALRGAGQTERYGERPGRRADQPAPTLRANGGGNASGGFVWKVPRRGERLETNQDSQLGGGRKERYSKSVDAPAPTLTARADLWKWKDAPATTVAGKGEVTTREHHGHGEQSGTALKLTRDEAATLQTFPPDFAWRGSKTSQFLQIGNAVPPLMGAAILGALLAEPGVRDAWDLVFAEVAG